MTTKAADNTDEFPLPPLPTEPSREERPPSAKVKVEVGGLTHQGKVRKNNEDIFLIGRAERSFRALLTNMPGGQIPSPVAEVAYGLMVADGMGGIEGGEVASQLATGTLVQLILDTPDWIMRMGEEEGARVMERIIERFQKIDAAVIAEAERSPRLSGMGTTMTLVYSLGADLFLGHVGDSRCYLYRNGDLRQLTHDHTAAQALADQGLIPPEEVARHRMRHVLTRALGGGNVEVDVQWLNLRDGDQILLCTDGLSDLVDDATILAVLRATDSAPSACQALIDQALERGGKDNVTVALGRYNVPVQR